MTARPGWPAVSGAATFQDIRRALAGQVARNTAGTIRKGILPAHTDPILSGTATMNIAVAAFVVVLDRNGAVFLANDGTVNVLLSSAPASGSRWSVVYVKQREMDAPFSDTANGPIIDKVESTTSLTAARALLPAGALELGYAQVAAGSANTNAVGVTIATTAPYTAMVGGVVPLRNETEMNAWTPHDGSTSYRLDSGDQLLRAGGVWVVPSRGDVVPITPDSASWRFVNIGLLPGAVRAEGSRVFMQGYFVNAVAAAVTANSNYKVGNIPPELAPPADVFFATTSAQGTAEATVSVKVNGDVYFIPRFGGTFPEGGLGTYLDGFNWPSK